VDNLGITILLLLVFVVISTPIICICKKLNIVKFHIISILIIIIAITLGAYWPHLYIDIRLELMGFNFNGMSDAERTMNVAPELRAEATKIYWSSMGVGWPLTAMLWAIMLLPYPTVVWLLALFYKKTTRR
jgi:hypothetical protein